MNFELELSLWFFGLATLALLFVSLKTYALGKIRPIEREEGILVPLSPGGLAKGGSVFLVLFNILLMLYLKVPPMAIGIFLLLVPLLSMVGFVLMGRTIDTFEDRVTPIVISFLLGLVTFTALNYVLLHFNNHMTLRIGNVLFFLCMLTLVYVRREMFAAILHSERKVSLFDPGTIFFMLFLASVLSVVTVYGLQPDQGGWGWNGDKIKHLKQFLDPIAVQGLPLPGRKLTHNWIQVFYLSQNLLAGEHTTSAIVSLYKASGLTIYVATLYLVGYLGKEFFGAESNEKLALLLFAAAFLSAINYPFFTFATNSYIPMFSFLGFYHNTTMWVSNLLALGGIILFLQSIENDKPLFARGMVLIVGSFFFKPSFFSVLAPAIFLFIPFYVRKLNVDKIFGLAIVILVIPYWKFYPEIFHLPAKALDVGVDPLLSILNASKNTFPALLSSHENFRVLLIFLLSFPVLVPAIADSVMRLFQAAKVRGVLVIPLYLLRDKKYIFFLLIFILSLAEKIFFYEKGRVAHDNFGWALQSAYLVCLPIYLDMYHRIKSVKLHVAASLLLFLQFANGIWKFVMYYFGKL